MAGSRLVAQWERMFAERLPVVVSDSSEASLWAASLGLSYLPLEAAVNEPPAAAFIVCTSDYWYSRISALRDIFSGSRALWLPLAAFDGADEAVRYGLEQVIRSDFGALTDLHHRAIALVQSSSRLAFRNSCGTDLTVTFGDKVEFATILDTSVPAGDFTPLLSYFEVEAEFPSASTEPPVSVSGILRPNGVLAAHGPRVYTRQDAEVQQAGELLRLATMNGQIPDIEVADGVITRLEIAGADVSGSFGRLAGEGHGLRLTEFSFGVNDIPAGTIRWDLNSPFNEGVLGMHIGIGDGYSGLHFDFVCPGAYPTT
jgi:hypothetical protein